MAYSIKCAASSASAPTCGEGGLVMSNNLCIFLLFTAATLRVVHLQPSMPRMNIGNCMLPTMADLGRSDVPSQDGLVAGGLTADGTDAGADRPFVRINYVCQSSGTVRGTVSSVSVVVQFETCSGTEVFCANEANRETVIEQFQFDCLAVATDPNGGDPRMNVFSFNSLSHNNWVRPRKQNSLFLIPARIDFLRPHQQNLLLSQPFIARLWA